MSGQGQGTSNGREQERQRLRRRMAIQHQVELRMNRLIRQMTQLVDAETKVAESRMEKHQIKTLLGVALETSSVEVIKHYILYQVGRDVAGTNWRHNDFGRKLVKALDRLRQDAERITRQVHRQLRLEDPSEEEVEETWLLLVRAYLGYLNRYFYFRKEEALWPSATSG